MCSNVYVWREILDWVGKPETVSYSREREINEYIMVVVLADSPKKYGDIMLYRHDEVQEGVP